VKIPENRWDTSFIEGEGVAFAAGGQSFQKKFRKPPEMPQERVFP
jgi:hypothetical protein